MDPEIVFAVLLKEFSGHPRFPDGRIDYSNATRAPVIGCFVRRAGRLLLLRRSGEVDSYRGKWNNVSGYLDNPGASLKQHAETELREELGIRPEQIQGMTLGVHHEFVDERGRTLVVFPVLADVSPEAEIRLNREHVEHKWVEPREIDAHDVMPSTHESLRRVLER